MREFLGAESAEKYPYEVVEGQDDLNAASFDEVAHITYFAKCDVFKHVKENTKKDYFKALIADTLIFCPLIGSVKGSKDNFRL